jgi:radical SAM superfamily enzyme YgiQ (UPF0313 family)
MKLMNVLLVNPPIYDFTAYDFWLRPYGMLRVAGQMSHSCQLSYFNFMVSKQRDEWGRGRYEYREIPKPKPLKDIPRRFRRFGRPRAEFREFLKGQSYDTVLIQTSMTYWYLGVQEAVEDIRQMLPRAKIVLGGIYATLCSPHAQSIEADLVIRGAELEPLWKLISVKPQKGVPHQPFESTNTGVIKITEGCPFRCTYCSAPLLWPEFIMRPTADCLDELVRLIEAGSRNIAFYDDALLYRADQNLVPFLKGVICMNAPVLFHTPNGLNARFITPDLAQLMAQAGFTCFFLGLESGDSSWQRMTGGKVDKEEFAVAVRHLRDAGARHITTYVMVGHPDSDAQSVEASIRFAHQCGTRVLLSEFSPIPNTADGGKCEKWANLEEPLEHNKTAFAIRRLGPDQLNELKKLNRSLNADIRYAPPP